MITLYVKTHNITGLKYFGKTTSKDPIKYPGSGTYWKNHIRKYGNDVLTEVIGQFDDKDECLKVAMGFSLQHNIVESDEWANLKIETLYGGWDHIDRKALYMQTSERMKGEGNIAKTPEARSKISRSMVGNTNGQGVIFTKERREKISRANLGKTLSEETKLKLSFYMKNLSPEERQKFYSPEAIAKRAKSNTGKKRIRICCIICHREISAQFLERHYNTKHKGSK